MEVKISWYYPFKLLTDAAGETCLLVSPSAYLHPHQPPPPPLRTVMPARFTACPSLHGCGCLRRHWQICRVSCDTLFFVSVRTKTDRNTKLFRLCFGLFHETIKKFFESRTETKWKRNKLKQVKMKISKAKKDKSGHNKAKQRETN
jgi:hypothetical protein